MHALDAPSKRALRPPRERVQKTNEEWFYTDANPPHRSKEILARCKAILKAWGVADEDGTHLRDFGRKPDFCQPDGITCPAGMIFATSRRQSRSIRR